MFEQISLIGNLGGNPEMRYTPSGKPVTNFSIAVNTRWTTSDGTPGERVTWYQIACWGRLADVTNQYLAKGRKVMVIGSRIEADAYIDREGLPQATLKVTADSVKFLDSSGEAKPLSEAEPAEAMEALPV